jgi:glycosyltransferase involved in cell wall biosynthesis
VEKAIESALSQSLAFYEIIVVDDGSTDGSHVIYEKYKNHAKVRVIEKANGGQLSAMNVGFEASSGDLICFLDADDAYQPDFLKEMAAVFKRHPEVDHVFCDRRIVDGDDNFIEIKNRYKVGHDINFGPTASKTRILYSWTGNSTSMNAFRRETLAKILPLDLEADYKINADMPLIYGSSIVGGHKYYLHEPLVDYRIHGANLWAGKVRKSSKDQDAVWEKTRAYTFQTIMEKNGRIMENPGLGLVQEYKDHPTKTKKETLIYLYAAWKSDQGLFKRIGDMVLIALAHS